MNDDIRAPPNLLWKTGKSSPQTLVGITEPQMFQMESSRLKSEQEAIRKAQFKILTLKDHNQDLE